jgi:DNA (cytosine-5)-methyltransferase 1
MKAATMFSNVGIDEVYLDEAGIEVITANELLKDRSELYKRLHSSVNMIQGSITDSDVYGEFIKAAKGIELLIATPPCQGMSVANAMKKSDDPRNTLITKVVDAINDLKPDHILIENVPGMSKSYINTGGEPILILDYIKQNISPEYNINYKVLNCKDYKTPQSRKRLIVLISKKGEWKHPKSNPKEITVRDAIGHLPSIESEQDSGIPWHKGKRANDNHILWMKNTPTGKTAFDNPVHYPKTIDKNTGELRRIKGFSTTYKRIDWDKPAPAITMMNGSVNSQNNVHPGNKQSDGTYSDARVLSVRELLILTGLPEDYLDDKQDLNENLVRKVLGESFPPKFCLSMFETCPTQECFV